LQRGAISPRRVKNANLVSCGVRAARRADRIGRGGWLAAGLALAGLLGTAGCGDRRPVETPVVSQPLSEFFPIRVGERTVRLQLAVLAPEQQFGLMQRRDLGPDDGMLFPYRKPQAMSFWMHNTPTPLDIGFFDAAGVLVEIYPLQPFDENTVRSRSDQLQYALEMNQGWFRAHGVRPGARLDLAAVAAALRARGADPRDYRLGE